MTLLEFQAMINEYVKKHPEHHHIEVEDQEGQPPDSLVLTKAMITTDTQVPYPAYLTLR
jgi:hypothetical protein